jgi:1-aminocyclopropane-1-carboxylate deaminase
MSENTPLIEIDLKPWTGFSTNTFIKREDLIHPEVSGNKWFKLKYYILELERRGLRGFVTFGGAYSNHIAATAACARDGGFESIGLIRGDELNKDSNSTLRKAFNDGMDLRFISRSEYKFRNDIEYLKAVKNEFPGYLVIPEGGGGKLGLDGTVYMGSRYKDLGMHSIVISAGTSATSLGIAISNPKSKVLAINCVGKGLSNIDVNKILGHYSLSIDDIDNYNLIEGYEKGGFGKSNEELVTFMREFNSSFDISLEQVYTSKSMMALIEFYKDGKLSKDDKVMFVHSGGLQGLTK